MTCRPEAVRSCPVAVLLCDSLLCSCLNVFAVIFIEGMGVLIIELPVSVDELENAVVIIPYHISVVFVFLVEINGSLNNVPDIVTGSLAET